VGSAAQLHADYLHATRVTAALSLASVRLLRCHAWTAFLEVPSLPWMGGLVEPGMYHIARCRGPEFCLLLTEGERVKCGMIAITNEQHGIKS